MEYILKAKEGEDEPCIFCSRIKQKYDKKNLILHRSQKAFIIMNRFPYNNGHLMVVPNRHIGDLMELSSGEKSELFSLLQLSTKALNRVMAPHGFNIGMNYNNSYGFEPDTGRLNTVSWDVGTHTDTATYTYLNNSNLLEGYTAGSGQETSYSYEPNRNLKTQVKNQFNSQLISQYDYTYDEVASENPMKLRGKYLLNH